MFAAPHASMVTAARRIYGASVIHEWTYEAAREAVIQGLRTHLAHLPPRPRLARLLSIILDVSRDPEADDRTLAWAARFLAELEQLYQTAS